MEFERFQPASSPESPPFHHPKPESFPLCYRKIGALRSSSVATVALDTALIKLTFLTDPRNGSGIPGIVLISGGELFSLKTGRWRDEGWGKPWTKNGADWGQKADDGERMVPRSFIWTQMRREEGIHYQHANRRDYGIPQITIPAHPFDCTASKCRR